MIKKIFVDMDGVLADFDGFIAEISKTRPSIMDDAQLWEVLKDFDHFYYKLPLMPYALEMIEFLRTTGAPLAILTALPKRRVFEQAHQDKVNWIHDFVDPNMEVLVAPCAERKQDFARPGYLLIDDSKLNIPQWRSKGGFGILHTSFEQTKHEVNCLL